mgnify:FL=1
MSGKGPQELLFGPTLKGPMMTSVQSSPAQWAGRTTINSGSATVVVSTFAVKSDSLIDIAALGNANLGIIAGTLVVASATLTGTVSNAAIAADSLVFLQDRSVAAQNSGNAFAFEVRSLAGGWFSAASPSQASADNAMRETTIMYTVFPKDGPPGALEVKTITDSSNFTLGRIDGRGVARDTTILWQITNTSHH